MSWLEAIRAKPCLVILEKPVALNSQQAEQSAADRLHGVFLGATKHASRRSQHRGMLSRFNIMLILLLLAIAIIVLWTLMTG